MWAIHPGGRSVLDAVEDAFDLDEAALAASRHVLRDYGKCRRQRSCLCWRPSSEGTGEGIARLRDGLRSGAHRRVHAVQRRGLTGTDDGRAVRARHWRWAAGGVLAAHLARYGRRVILAERSSGPHDKVCGEFLSEEAAGSLSEMGIDLAALGAVQISAVRLHEGSKSVTVELPFRAYGLSRRILDEAVLAAALSSGAELLAAFIKVVGPERLDMARKPPRGDVLFAENAFLATGKHDLRGWRRPTAAMI